MKKNYNLKHILVILLFLLGVSFSYSQCGLAAYHGIIAPTSGTTFITSFNYGPGRYFAFPVLNGGSYAVTTCGASIDTQITCWNNLNNAVIAYNDDNGPLCAGSAASVNGVVPSFTDWMWVQVSQFNCLPGGSASINVSIRQNNNLAFTSSSAAMCSGQTRALSATPAPLGSNPTGYGNAGTFSGTGVSGNIFTAPVVGAPTNYVITYSFGYVTQTQTITVNPLPTVGATASSTNVCLGSPTTLNGTGANTYVWTGGVTNGVAFAPAAYNTYTVTGTSLAGCTSTNLASISVSITSLPFVSAAAVPTAVCVGESVILIGGGANTFTWSGGVTNGAAFVPTATTNYTVVGTLASTGCTNSAVQTVSVKPLPVVSASTTNSVICLGGLTTLNGSGANTYAWSGGITNGVPFSPASTTSYFVTGTNTLTGCTSTNTAVQSITVNSLPNVTANTSNPAVCIGGTTSLSGGGATTYTWSGGVTNGIPFSPSASLTYTVTGTLAATGCTNIATRAIAVNPLPVVTAGSSNSIICFGQSTTLNGGGANSYTWSGGVTNGVPFTPTATTSYTVNGTLFSSGCTSTNSAVQTISVNSLPNITASASSPIVCAGDATTLNGVGGTTYTWSGGVSNGVAFTPGASATYTVSGTLAATGCSNTATQFITVNALPSITANASPPTVCLGSTTTLSGAGATTYTWSGGVSDGVAFTPTATTTFTVIGTLAATGCTNIATRLVTLSSLPIVTANVSSGAICNGGSAYVLGGGAVTYTWSGGVVNGIPFSPTATANYSVVGTNAAGCTSTNSAVQTIIVNALPIVSASTTSAAICIGGTTSLIGLGADTYTWTGGAMNATPFTPTTTSNYSVYGTSTITGCTSTNTAVQTIVVNALPPVTANATNSVICLGGITALSGGGATTYTWTGGVSDGVAFSPSTTTSYTVIGTLSSTGCKNSASRIITVNPLPVVTASASFNSICNGFSISLNGGGASTYTWSGGAIDGVLFTPNATTVYSVTGTNSLGCVSSNTATTTVTVNASPSVTANVTSSVICIGGTIALSGAGATTYTWLSGVSNGIAFTPTASNNYTVIGTLASTGCTNSAVSSVIVNSLPNVSGIPSSSVICNGATLTLNGTGADTYSWTGGITNGVSFTPSVTASYTVTGTNTLTGCSSTNVAIQTVTVNPLPILTASASVPAVCIGGTTSLHAAGANTYTWTGGILDAVSFSPSATTSYTLTGTNTLSGCSNTNVVVQTITVNPLPLVTSTSATVCVGVVATLTASGASTYSWSTGALTSTLAQSPTQTTNYTVTGTDANNCIDTETTSITVFAIPVITANSSTICVGDSTTLVASGANTYTWSTSVQSSSIVVLPVITTTYNVTGNIVGCPIQANPVTVTVNVNALPVVTISSTLTVSCANQEVTIILSGANTFSVNSISSTNTVVITPSVTTVYTVVGTDANGCSNSAIYTQNVTDCVGFTTTNSKTSQFSVYPNPNNGEFFVSVDQPSLNARLKIYNAVGQLVMEEVLTQSTQNLDIRTLDNGIYVLMLFESSELIQRVKLIKQ